MILSDNLKNVLKYMGDNLFVNKLLALNIETLYNYIDISDIDDIITFIPTNKVTKLIGKITNEFEVVESGRYLKPFSKKNIDIFNLLGYNPIKKNDDYEDGYPDSYVPEVGTVGTVISEATGQSGRIYCLFKYSGGEIVFNKSSLNKSNTEKSLWSTNRNSIKIGRFIRSIFSESISSDIEEFVNKFKAAHAIEKNELNKFDIVSGDDIRKWYKKENYLDGGGPLNNSCMASVDEEFFDIYVDNARMVVLYTKGGKLVNGKYTSDKVRGRAILWNDVTMDDEPITFMDRVYTTLDCDVELFRAFAKQNGWWYKKNQSMDTDDELTDGDQTLSDVHLVKRMSVDYKYYPFMDTLCYIDTDNCSASNMDYNYDKRARCTNGRYEDDN